MNTKIKNFLISLIYFVVYFVCQFVIQMVFMGIGTMLGMNTENDLINFSMNHLFLMTLAANIITIILFVFFMKFRKKNLKEEWNLVPAKMKLYIYPALSAFLLSFAWAFATYDLSFANSEQMAKSAAFYSNIIPGLGTIMMILTLLLAQPIMEEILCRGIMLNKLKQSFSVWAAIFVSSLIFGLAHLMAGGIYLAVGATLMGILFGIIFVKTQSLYPTIIAHIFANLPDFIMSFLPELPFGVRMVLACILVAASIITFNFIRKDF